MAVRADRCEASIDVPISGPSLPGPVKSVDLQVTVAGRVFTQSFPAQPNQITTFTWDGRDAYGRLLQGPQLSTIDLGNTYDGVYQQTSRFGYNGNGITITGSRTRKEVTLHSILTTVLGSPWDDKPDGLGSWELDVHHHYDPIGHVLHFGDGTDEDRAFLPSVIQPFAGNGQGGLRNNPHVGDGGLATAAVTVGPHGMTVGPDGSVYIGEDDGCIRRVTPNGIINTFAGQCQQGNAGGGGYSGDGGLATAAKLNGPYAMGFGPDGSFYFADALNNRIRRVDSSGIITTVVGTGTASFTGDGGPALQATLKRPEGLDVTADGTLLIADTGNCVIRRVSPDGIIATAAGKGCAPLDPPGNGGPALAAALSNPVSVALAADGSFYIAESNFISQFTGWVRRVTTDGIIHPFLGNGVIVCNGSGVCTGSGMGGLAVNAQIGEPRAIAVAKDGSVYVGDSVLNTVYQVTPDANVRTAVGVSSAGGFAGDNGPAAACSLSAGGNEQLGIGLAVSPDGTLYVADWGNNRVRRVAPPLAGFTTAAASYPFASKDGSQVYVFDGTGRHLQTLNAYTQAVLYQFAYDGNGRLSRVTDVDGNVTQINHDGTGNPTSIVNPYGGVTSLAVDANGYLATVTDPASETSHFTYDANGLMQTMTDARGGLHQFTFDSAGKLTHDQDPAGGAQSLARTTQPSGAYSVNITSALGKQTTYGTSTSTTGALGRQNTFPDGTQASSQMGLNYSTATTMPDGTTTTETDAPDPRFGMLAPVASVTTKTPSGLTSTQTVTRSATFTNGNFATLTEQTNLNGNTWTQVFNASTNTWTTTSPVGRQIATVVDAAGRPTQTTTASVAPFGFTYDARGRLVSTAQGTTTWTQGYDATGFLASMTDPLSHTISFTNDAVGRPTTTQLADTRQLLTTYDADGNQTSLSLPGTSVHAFTYTPVDLLASYDPPALGSGSPDTSYTYDVDRNLTNVTRPDGLQIGYAYDSAGRLQTTTILQGALARTYSPTTGLLTALSAPSGESLGYTYDGFLRTGVTWSGPVAGSLSLGFDNNFRMTSQTVNGTALAFGYDADGLLTGAGNLTVTRDPGNGRVTGTTLGAVTDSYTYDANGLFASYSAQYSGNNLYAESVQRDAARRITQKTETIGSTTHVWGYTYDSSGRLTDVTEDGNFASHYAYDADDNRTTFTNTSGTVNPTYDAQDRLLTYGSTSYTYTANGDLTGKTSGSGTTSYTYDALGNLLGVTLPTGGPIAYVVDGENRRVGKRVSGTLTTGFLYKDALNVVVQLDGSANVVNRFVFGSKPDVPDYFTSSSGTFRILSDHLGSPRLIVSTSTGVVAEEIDYDEFGNVTNDTSPGLTPFGFAGGIYDKDTGLVRFGARDYNPSAGRWTSEDPLRFIGGTNIYIYASNDPVDATDATGKAFISANCIACWDYAVLLATFCIVEQKLRDPFLQNWCNSEVRNTTNDCAAICQDPFPPPPPPPPPPDPPICDAGI